MATFTMELKEVIALLYGETMDEDDYEQEYAAFTFNGVTYGKLPVLPQYNDIGLGYYPIFNENYRAILNGKIIDEYYNQEIGTETIDNFQLIMRKKMDQIMPFYNQLYDSLDIPYSALETMDIHSVGSSSLNGTETSNGTTTSVTGTKTGSRIIGSDFPQSMLSGDEDYASNGSDVNSTVDVDGNVINNGESENNSNSNSDTRVTGYQGIASRLVMEYRSSLINIDTMIIDEVKDCFMLLLNNGDEYFATERFGW